MLNLINFFRILFNTSRISDLNLRKFCEDNLQRMIANNPGGIYTILITDTTTAYNGYYGAITDEDARTAIKEGSTIAMNNAMKDFQDNVSQQEGIIRGTYGKTSPIYQEFFPHGLTEYSNANLQGVGVLMDRMVTASTAHQADLGVPFLTLFTNLRDTFFTARTAQLNLIGDVAGKKDVTETTRDDVEIQLMRNVLFIAYNNVGNTSAANTYFDQSFIRPKQQKTYSGDVPANETVNAAERTFEETDDIVLKNTGTTALTFCLAPTAGDACAVGVNVNAGEETTVTASELGDVANHFLNVTNNEGTDGSYSVVVEL